MDAGISVASEELEGVDHLFSHGGMKGDGFPRRFSDPELPLRGPGVRGLPY